jgi:hypothetical protein
MPRFLHLDVDLNLDLDNGWRRIRRRTGFAQWNMIGSQELSPVRDAMIIARHFSAGIVGSLYRKSRRDG